MMVDITRRIPTMFTNLTFYATAAAGTAGGLSSLTGMLLPLAAMFALMYFLMIRPQRKKEKALRDQINAMKVGDKCVTIGGIVGKVVNIKDDEVTVQTSVANTLVTVRKSAISTVIAPISED
jgi:preprotein translocase subunit YajC